MYILSAILLLLNVFIIALLLRKKNDHATAELSSLREDIGRLEKIIREECRYLLENHSKTARENREELAKSLGTFRTENAESLKHIAEQNFQSLETVRRTLDSSFQEFRKIFTENIQSFNELQREKFGELNKKTKRTAAIHGKTPG